MKSYGAYGLNKISPKVLISTFAILVLTPLISIALKISGIITNIEQIKLFAFGAISTVLWVSGIYMLKEALLIRKSFIVTNAEVVDNSMSIAGRTIMLEFTHNNEQQIATVLLKHGHKGKGSVLRVIFDPENPSVVYLYGFKYYFVPAVPVIIGCVFFWHVMKTILG